MSVASLASQIARSLRARPAPANSAARSRRALHHRQQRPHMLGIESRPHPQAPAILQADFNARVPDRVRRSSPSVALPGISPRCLRATASSTRRNTVCTGHAHGRTPSPSARYAPVRKSAFATSSTLSLCVWSCRNIAVRQESFTRWGSFSAHGLPNFAFQLPRSFSETPRAREQAPKKTQECAWRQFSRAIH